MSGCPLTGRQGCLGELGRLPGFNSGGAVGVEMGRGRAGADEPRCFLRDNSGCRVSLVREARFDLHLHSLQALCLPRQCRRSSGDPLWPGRSDEK